VTSQNEKEFDSLETILPKKGWLGDYLHFTSGLEVCSRFRFFSACCVMGAVINNHVWIQRGDADLLPKLFPNPWVILLAPPGRGHKTACINMACNCLEQATPNARVLADKLTPETLVKNLSAPETTGERIRIGPRDATGLIKAPEISVFFGKQQYNVGMVSLITDLYDFREIWRGETIGRGKEVLKNNCISILGGSTPQWLQHMLPQDAFTGGFMSRFILVEMPINYFKRVTLPKKPSNSSWKALIEGLRVFEETKGKFEWTVSGLKEYDICYTEGQPTGNVQEDAYRERESEQTLRIAMLLAINKGRLKLDGSDVLEAKEIIYCLRKEVGSRIEQLSTHPRMQLVSDIEDLLKIHGKLSEPDLLNRTYRYLSQGERQFYEAISVLRNRGVLCVEDSGEKKGDGTKCWIFSLKKIKEVK
jgi:hypothetical protein